MDASMMYGMDTDSPPSKPNFDYITRAYRTPPPDCPICESCDAHYKHTLTQSDNAGDHEFLSRRGWVEVFRENNPGGFVVLYKRANNLPHPRMRNH